MHAFLYVPSIVATCFHNIDLFIEFLTCIGNNDVSFRSKAETIWIPKTIGKYFIKTIATNERIVRWYLIRTRRVHVNAKDTAQKILRNVLAVAVFHMPGAVIIASTTVAYGNVEVPIRAKCKHSRVVISLWVIHCE